MPARSGRTSETAKTVGIGMKEEEMVGGYKLTEEESKRLERDFTYHPPKETQPLRYEEIRAYARTFAEIILLDCPRSREASLAMTKLDEVVFWANASIARNE